MTTPLNVVRIYETLKALGKASNQQISELALSGREYVRRVCVDLHECGLIHIAEYRRRSNRGGTRIVVWKFGPGRDAVKDVKRNHTEARRRRENTLTEKFGIEITRRILKSRANGGPDQIVSDGRVIWKRGKARGKYVRVKTA